MPFQPFSFPMPRKLALQRHPDKLIPTASPRPTPIPPLPGLRQSPASSATPTRSSPTPPPTAPRSSSPVPDKLGHAYEFSSASSSLSSLNSGRVSGDIRQTTLFIWQEVPPVSSSSSTDGGDGV